MKPRPSVENHKSCLQHFLQKNMKGVTSKKISKNYFRALLKAGLSPSKTICVICFIESPLKMMKNAFYFILKALFVFKIFKFLSRLFRHVGKSA